MQSVEEGTSSYGHTGWPNILAASYSLYSQTTSSYVKDTGDFISKLEVIDVEDEDMMVSFNIVSLFTRVPVSPSCY